MSTTVHSLVNFDLSTLQYTTPKKLCDHYYVCAQYAHDSNENYIPGKFYFQTPKMMVKSELLNEHMKATPFLDTVCDNEEFIESIKNLDDHVFSTIKNKRKEWFSNKIIDDTFLEVGQTHSIMKNNVIRLKFDKNAQIFNHEKASITLTDVHENAIVKCIVQFMGVWFTATRWGITLNVVQLHVYPPKRIANRSYHGYMFPDEDDNESIEDDDDDYNSMPIPPPGV
jgi:hypothetical protein